MWLRNALKVSGGVSVVVNANASIPSRTPSSDGWWFRLRNTIHSYPTPRRMLRSQIVSALFDTTAAYRAHSDRTPGGIAARRSTHAGTIHHMHTGTARFADLRDHAVCLMKRCERHGLCRRCD